MTNKERITALVAVLVVTISFSATAFARDFRGMYTGNDIPAPAPVSSSTGDGIDAKSGNNPHSVAAPSPAGVDTTPSAKERQKAKAAAMPQAPKDGESDKKNMGKDVDGKGKESLGQLGAHDDEDAVQLGDGTYLTEEDLAKLEEEKQESIKVCITYLTNEKGLSEGDAKDKCSSNDGMRLILAYQNCMREGKDSGVCAEEIFSHYAEKAEASNADDEDGWSIGKILGKIKDLVVGAFEEYGDWAKSFIEHPYNTLVEHPVDTILNLATAASVAYSIAALAAAAILAVPEIAAVGTVAGVVGSLLTAAGAVVLKSVGKKALMTTVGSIGKAIITKTLPKALSKDALASLEKTAVGQAMKSKEFLKFAPKAQTAVRQVTNLGRGGTEKSRLKNYLAKRANAEMEESLNKMRSKYAKDVMGGAREILEKKIKKSEGLFAEESEIAKLGQQKEALNIAKDWEKGTKSIGKVSQDYIDKSFSKINDCLEKDELLSIKRKATHNIDKEQLREWVETYDKAGTKSGLMSKLRKSAVGADLAWNGGWHLAEKDGITPQNIGNPKARSEEMAKANEVERKSKAEVNKKIASLVNSNSPRVMKPSTKMFDAQEEAKKAKEKRQKLQQEATQKVLETYGLDENGNPVSN